jgi:hypothetical protein
MRRFNDEELTNIHKLAYSDFLANIKTYAMENWHIEKVASKYDKIYSELA